MMPVLKIRKYGAIGRITLKNQFAYMADLLVRTIFLLIILYVFVQLWTVTYEGAGRDVIGGYRYDELIWYLIFSESMVMAVPRLHLTVSDEVKTGGIAYLLSRPMSYILYRLAEFAGEYAVRLLTNLLVGSLLGVWLFGPPSFGWGWAGFVLVAAGAMVLNFTVRMILSLAAFWVEETQGLIIVYDKLVFTVGGMLLPLELLPDTVRGVCSWLPFPAMIYYPVKTVIHFDGQRMVEMLGIQLAWGAVLGAVLWMVYRMGVKKLNVNGG